MALTYDPTTGLSTGTSGTGFTIDPSGQISWSNTTGPQVVSTPSTAPQLPGINLPALPDLASLFGPIFAQQIAGLNAGGIADAAARDAARQRAIIQFGEAPSFTGADLALINGGGDQAAFMSSLGNAPELAQQNSAAGLSTVARLTDADKQAQLNINNVLGARGLTRSGETGYQLGNEAKAYAQSQFDARQKLLDYLSGVQSQFTTGERQRQMGLAQIQMAQAQAQAEAQMAAANWALQQQVLNQGTAYQQAQLNQYAAANPIVSTIPGSTSTVGYDPVTGMPSSPLGGGGPV